MSDDTISHLVLLNLSNKTLPQFLQLLTATSKSQLEKCTLKISKLAKFESDLYKTNQDIE